MFDDFGDPVGFPGQLNFVHKRIIGAAKSFVTSGFNPLAAVGGFLAPTAPPIRLTRQPCPRGTRQTLTGCKAETRAEHLGQGFNPALHLAHGDDVSQLPLTSLGVPLSAASTSLVGRAGGAVMGRYGAGLEPVEERRSVSTCLPGMVLGDDGICYNRGQVPNKRRMWPKGRKPLLTGGEMNAITIAARAARRVKATTKKLQALGLLDRPRARPRALARPAAQHQLTAGPRIINVD